MDEMDTPPVGDKKVFDTVWERFWEQVETQSEAYIDDIESQILFFL
jgi:hypothetical protein